MVQSFGYHDLEVTMPMTQILPGVYQGDEDDAKVFLGAKVAVHEAVGTVTAGSHWVPIVEPYDHRNTKVQLVASRLMLDAATQIVRAHQKAGRRVLLHCAAGIERSPLTMAWFLRRYGYARNLNDAYAKIRALRPQIQECTHWLPPHSGP